MTTLLRDRIQKIVDRNHVAPHDHDDRYLFRPLTDADIPAAIARDAEVIAAVAAHEALDVMDGDAAGGVLSGTYPDPGFAVDMATQAELDAHKSSADHDDRYYTETEIDALLATEIAYVQITANVTVNATSAAAPNNVVTSGVIEYDGSPIEIEFFASRVDVGASGAVVLNLWDGTTDLGRIAHFAGITRVPALIKRRLVPTAANHEYRIRAWRATADGNIIAGPGGVDPEYVPAFIQIKRVR